jgi:cobyrinic acid a,c-diamide synthase
LRHGEKARTAIELYTHTPVIGVVPRDDSMKISMRHLGLIPAMEGRRKVSDFNENLGRIKTIINEGIDIERLLSLAGSAEPIIRPEENIFKPTKVENTVRIGVALDEAFNFYYRDNLELLELAGAEIKYFSPVNDSSLPSVDGLYIGGGYPELFTRELEANENMRDSIKQASAGGLPIYAECGGLMYLTQEIKTDITRNGNYNMAEMEGGTFRMVGALPGTTMMGHKRVVSYNIGRFVKDNVIGKAGTSFIGHEFHHSEIVDIPEDTSFAINLERGTGIKGKLDGILVENTMAAYAHLHGASYTGFARYFVDFCIDRK